METSRLVTAMYMAMGARNVRTTENTPNFDEYGGEIGFFYELAQFVDIVEWRCGLVEELPGVVDYEVSEPFGAWYMLNKPRAFDGCVKLHEMLDRFFGQ